MRGIWKFFGVFLLLLGTCVPPIAAGPERLVGTIASVFSLKNIVTGEAVSLEALKGKVALLDFWATWCGPCKQAIPHIAEVNRRFKDQEVFAISIDLKEDEDSVTKFAQSNQMNWIVVIDRDGGIAKNYEVTAIPTFFLVDRMGVIRYAHEGFFKELRDDLSKRITELLKEKPEGIACRASSSGITMGESIMISGTLMPGRSAPITLSLTRPDGSGYTVNLVSSVDGSYSHRFAPDRAGVWSASASVGGVTSPPARFEVKDKPIMQSITFIAMIAILIVAIGMVAAVILVRRSRSKR